MEEEPEIEESNGRRFRSTIDFPYVDLGAAEGIARALFEKGGGSSSIKQLAGWLDSSPTSGSFRSRISATKLFGFIESEGADVKLTDIGWALIDPEKEANARIDAFLRVPLFQQVFKKYESLPLPNPNALESQMQQLGVSPKQTDRARQTFTSSANSAGFIDSNTRRLVLPVAPSLTTQAKTEKQDSETTINLEPDKSLKPKPEHNLHPLIQGLLVTIPKEGNNWSIEGRASWLKMAASIFEMIYPSGEIDPIEINIKHISKIKGD